MKTLLYNPIFVNPLAYYVFPNLNGRLTPQTDTTLELAKYVGSIEVKVIAYGDTGKAVYFSNTNYIDLSEFIDSWVRISLYTKAGNVVLGEWKIGNAEIEEPPYIDPEVLESLQGIWIADQNTNDSPTRNIIKNKIPNKGGDFEILNAAYKLDSGYGKYGANFNTWSKAPNNKLIYTDRLFKIQSVNDFNSYGYVIWETTYQQAFKIKVTGFPIGKTMYYTYFTESGQQRFPIKEDGEYTLPSSLENTSIGFGFNVSDGLDESFIGLTITLIPEYKGAFVTDGIDDLIVSQKKTLEIVGENNPCTVVSMIGFIGGTQHYFNNAIGTTKMNKNRIVTNNNTTGIFGYTANSVGAPTKVINNILGDKNNYNSIDENASAPVDRRFSVKGYIRDGMIMNLAEIAWYWTFIANKVLTTDEINQVIAYYNLDKYVTPDVYYNVKKQGLTNENHAQFGDKLIDYSGNGHDMQLYNIAWEGMSGVNGYPVVFGKNKTWFENSPQQGEFYPNRINIYNQNNNQAVVYSYIVTNGELNQNNNKEIPSFKIKVNGINNKYYIYYRYINNDGETVSTVTIEEDGEHILPKSNILTKIIEDYVWVGISISKKEDYVTESSDISIEVIPSYENALVTDGVEDYGKVEGLPVYKDYTIVADRTIYKIENNNNGSSFSKAETSSTTDRGGAFIFELSFANGNTNNYSFYEPNGIETNIFDTRYSYLSKYNYNGKPINVGNTTDSDKMWFAVIRDRDSRFSAIALRSAMLFPYSLSEFLIERQLKRHKAGTLHEGKIEFRPNISSNIPYKDISIYQETNLLYNSQVNNTGTYIKKDVPIRIHVNPGDLNVPTSITVNGVTATNLKLNSNNQYYADFDITKSPQKIDITIDEYIRFEDIVQAYPGFFTFYNTETDEIYSWGSTIKVGSTIKIKSITNLLENVYNIDGYIYDGKQHSYQEFIDKEFVVDKENMNFSIVKRYLIDDNEPKVVLSPERLRLSNETYKLLGHIPDLSGNGNHGVLNNFAYKDMSGEGGYVEDFSAWNKYPFANVTYNKISIARNPDANWVIYTTSGHVLDPYEIKVSGIPADGEIVYRINNVNTVLVNGINKLEGATITAASGFYITKHGNTYWKDLVIEQLPKYKGSVTFDGVDDFVSIPTLHPNGGGKQLLMKMNWGKLAKLVYDQRGNPNEYAIFTGGTNDGDRIAYKGRNNGNTYIDGVLNDTVPVLDLQNITHNVTITNPLLAGKNFSSPIIGSNIVHADYFSDLSMYTFMLFDEISTDDNIMKLNEIIGIESNVNMSTVDFTTYTVDNRLTADIKPNKIHLTHIEGAGSDYIYIERNIDELFKPFKIKVTGLIEEEVKAFFVYSQGSFLTQSIEFINGEIEIPISPSDDRYKPMGFAFASYTSTDCDISIEFVSLI